MKINSIPYYMNLSRHKIIKNQQDEWDAEYNYLEAKYNESLSKNPDDGRTKELLITLINS